jgi:HK97 family phage major capsid protein
MPILFGNMANTYRIFDRRGVMMLRDPYTNKPYVNFYMTKRVGGGLWNPEWMRYHKVAV